MSDQVLQSLLEQFLECDLVVNERVSDELVKIDSAAVVTSMHNLLRDPDQPTFVHKQAAKLLGRLQNNVVPTLREVLQEHPHEAVRSIALESLGQFDDKPDWEQDLIPPGLLPFLQDPERGPKAAAILGKFGSRLQIADILLILKTPTRTCSSFEDVFQKALAQEGKEVVPYLLQALNNTNPKLRLIALKTLFFIGTAAEIPAIWEALKDSDREVRSQAALTLKKIRDSQSFLHKWARSYFADRLIFLQDEAGFLQYMRNQGFVNESEEELLKAFQKTQTYLKTPCLNPNLVTSATGFLMGFGRSTQMCSEDRFFTEMRARGFVNEPEEELIKAYLQGVETVKNIF